MKLVINVFEWVLNVSETGLQVGIKRCGRPHLIGCNDRPFRLNDNNIQVEKAYNI